MASSRSLHDFSQRRVGARLVEALKRRRNASTAADLVAATGLPRVQVESALRPVLDEYGGQLRVTESGELLYYFPHGLHSRTRGPGPSLRRAAERFLRGAGRALALLFKIWIVLMLVGYTVLFALILLAAVFVSIAAAASGRGGDDRGRSRGGGMGGGVGGGYLASSLLRLLLFMWMFDSPAGRYPGRYPGPAAPWARSARGTARAPRRPLYRSVFAFVFGEEDPNRGWEERERIRVIAFLRRGKGVITLEELMALTGRAPERAQELLNALLVELDGEPSVTEAGTLVFLFPGLLASAGPATAGSAFGGPPPDAPPRTVLRFNDNPSRTNGWIAFFNGFNLLFGAYFLFSSLQPHAPGQGFSSLYLGLEGFLGQAGAWTPLVLGVVLGAVPFVFSLLFYLVALLRAAWVRRVNEEIRRGNLRRAVYSHVLAGPGEVDPREIRPAGDEERPKDPRREIRRALDELAAFKQADIGPAEGGGFLAEDGRFIYRFPELARELADLEAYRRAIDPGRFDVGRTVFDSGEDPPPRG